MDARTRQWQANNGFRDTVFYTVPQAKRPPARKPPKFSRLGFGFRSKSSPKPEMLAGFRVQGLGRRNLRVQACCANSHKLWRTSCDDYPSDRLTHPIQLRGSSPHLKYPTPTANACRGRSSPAWLGQHRGRGGGGPKLSPKP